MLTTQLRGLIALPRLTRRRETCTTRLGIQQSSPSGEFAIRAAPTRHLLLDAEETNISAGEVRPNLRQAAVLDGSQSLLRDAGGDGHVANPACPAGLLASRAQRNSTG